MVTLFLYIFCEYSNCSVGRDSGNILLYSNGMLKKFLNKLLDERVRQEKVIPYCLVNWIIDYIVVPDFIERHKKHYGKFDSDD